MSERKFKSVKIRGTKNDLETGIRRDSRWCPLALAIRRELPQCDVEVYSRELRIDGKDIPLPEDAKIFVKYFDMGIWGLPHFGFTLELPDANL